MAVGRIRRNGAAVQALVGQAATAVYPAWIPISAAVRRIACGIRIGGIRNKWLYHTDRIQNGYPEVDI